MTVNIKLTISTNYVFNLENVIYCILLTKQNFRIIVCIDDQSEYSTNKQKVKDYSNITDQIDFLEKCGVSIDRIVRYSEYSSLTTLYLDRVLDMGGKKLESDSVIILDDQILAMNDIIKPEFVDMIINYVLNIDYTLRSNTDTQMNLMNVSKILGINLSQNLFGINDSLGRCPIHLLSPSSLEVLMNFEMLDFNQQSVQTELHRIERHILKSIGNYVLDFDKLIKTDNHDKFCRVLVDPIPIEIKGASLLLTIEQQNINITDKIFVDRSFSDILRSRMDSFNVRLRFGTNIMIGKRNDSANVIGTIIKTKKKKIVSFDWLPESKDVLKFITDDNHVIYYLPDVNRNESPSLIRLNGVLMLAVPEYKKITTNNDMIPSIDNEEMLDWFSPTDISTDASATKGMPSTGIERYRLCPIENAFN